MFDLVDIANAAIQHKQMEAYRLLLIREASLKAMDLDIQIPAIGLR